MPVPRPVKLAVEQLHLIDSASEAGSQPSEATQREALHMIPHEQWSSPGPSYSAQTGSEGSLDFVLPQKDVQYCTKTASEAALAFPQ